MAVSPRQARRRTPLLGLSSPHDEVHTLDNGLTVVVREDRSAPVIAAQAWCRTGSMHEGRWLGAGLSHVLEHMLFKGTARRTGPRLDQEVTEAGGYFNAYTSFDRTVYWINAPSSGTAVALDVLCDVMQNAALPPEELARELEVIRREMDMNHDDPARRSSRRLFETAFTRHPCRFTIIGYPHLFSQIRPEDIRAYYRERYVPNNVFYVVVGDVRTDAVVEQIRSAYTGSPARPLEPLYLASEPPQTALRRVVEEAPIALGHLHHAWHIPDAQHPDIPALDVLATLLGSGRSSRLYQRVRERLGLVHSAEAWTYSPGSSGVFGLSAVVDRERHEEANKALLREVETLRSRAVPAAELRKTVKQFLAATLGMRKTMQGQAQDLGHSWMVAGDLQFSERYLTAVTAVRAQDLRRVAHTYLADTSRTHYALLPPGPKPAAAQRSASTPPTAPSLQVMPNGLRVVVRPDHRLPFVDLRLVLRAGVLEEDDANNGLTWLLARGLLKGTRRRSAEVIAREIESVGGQLDTYGGNNSLGIQLEVLRDDLGLGIDLLRDVLLQATFPAREIAREREVQLASIRAQQDQMLKSAARLMRETLFGPHGYGLDVLGREPTVSALGSRQLRAAHRRWIRPDRAVLAVVGDFDPAKLPAQLSRALDRWTTDTAPPPPTEALPMPRARHLRRVQSTRDKRQAVVVLGFPGTTLTQPDRYAMELLQEACSDLGSRLFLRVRDRLGLAYYVGAQHFAGLTPGYFAFYAGTSPGQVARVEQELLVEAANLRETGLTQEELDRAKAKILGQKKIARQDPGTLAMTLALDELYGLGYEHSELESAGYEAVTREDVCAAAQRYLVDDRAVLAVVSGTEASPE